MDAQKNTYIIDIDTTPFEKISLMIAAAETDDEMGTVIRLHGIIEGLVSFYIKEMSQGEIAKYAKEPREFGAKLGLATAFGLPLPIARVVHQINIIRNKLAHTPETPINTGDMKELARKANGLSEIFPDFSNMDRRYITINLKSPDEKLLFGKHGNRIDFIIIGFAFHTAMTQWLIQDAAIRRLAKNALKPQ
ncbi:hypothetical protein [Pseudomonas sp. NPDC089401]|uniref:hypothetical protein n=1 Tax=Pseudomonas sp. NPDC089401 TaxID=3364462 RepID=UPI003825AE2B